MDAFKVYLPSNACPVLFPDNTATDYRTRFDKAIDLSGSWEVGVGSIAYSSRINDEKERAQVQFNVTAPKEVTINSLHYYKYLTSAKDQWKGYKGIFPPVIEEDSKKIDLVVQRLNDTNRVMLSHDNVRGIPIYAFSFFLNKKTNRVEYNCYDSGLVIELTTMLGHVLGFGFRIDFSGTKRIVAENAPAPVETPLKAKYYLVKYMNTIAQKKLKRIIIKQHGEKFDGDEAAFLKLWETKVTSQVNIRAEFKKRKLVLHNYNPDIGITFSADFAQAFAIPHPFFGVGSRWGNSTSVMNFDRSAEEWFIEIFTTKMSTTTHFKDFQLSMDVYPWRYKSMKEVLRVINVKARNTLQEFLKQGYDSNRHLFQLSMERVSDHCRLKQGSFLACTLSKNLAYLLGFPDTTIRNKNVLATREVDALANHSRQLHLISNVIQPTAYGKHQRQILCDFLHKQNAEPITEKRFNPISYHPVARNVIDMIHVQLTDDAYNPISIQDASTIVTLYFRKSK